MDNKSLTTIQALAFNGQTKDSWESLMQLCNIAPESIKEDFWYHTADIRDGQRLTLINDVVPAEMEENKDPDIQNTLTVLKACTKAFNYNNHETPEVLNRGAAARAAEIENILPLVDKDNMHLAFNSLATIWQDSGKTAEQQKNLQKALDAAPDRKSAYRYAAKLLQTHYQADEKTLALETIAAYEKVLQTPAPEHDDISYYIHRDLAYAAHTMATRYNDKSFSESGSRHFEAAIALSDSMSDRRELLSSYQHLYDTSTPQYEEIGARLRTVSRCCDAAKKLKQPAPHASQSGFDTKSAYLSLKNKQR